MRQHLGVRPGESVDFEALPDGRVLIFPAPKEVVATPAMNPFRQFLGIGIAGLSTEAILRETRGDDCMR
jgi:bifunctional DNA-binding transcriptional regulator/antitoxin component of YhaV-PrlF toxin-antitoxin module